MPDGDVGQATTAPEGTPAADEFDGARPEHDALPGDPLLQPAPRPSNRRRSRKVIGTNGAAPTPAPDQQTSTPTAAQPPTEQARRAPAGGDVAEPAPAGRRSMSARLGDVPAAPASPQGPPIAVQPSTTADRARSTETTQEVEVVARDDAEPVLLVPEVLPPTAPAPRIVPSAPEIAPATEPTEILPPIVEAVPPEAAPYDLAADDPSLIEEPPVVRTRRRRPRVRRVTRVIRTIDTWSVFKVSLLFAAVLYVSALLSGVLLWNVAYATGTIDNAERFMESFGWQTFEFHGDEIFHDAWIIGLFLAAGLVGLAVLAAATFNLVSDIVGGVRVTVLEEEMVVRPVTRRRKQRIRKAPPKPATPAAASAEPATPAPGSDLVVRPTGGQTPSVR